MMIFNDAPIIDRHPQTISQETSVREAIVLMAQTQASCIWVVVDQADSRTLVGLFSERDAVRLIAAEADIDNLLMANVMSSPMVMVTEAQAQDALTIGRLMEQYQLNTLPLIDWAGNLLGEISNHPLPENSKSEVSMQSKFMPEAILATIPHVSETTSLLEVANLMSQKDVRYIVVDREQNKGSILEKQDFRRTVPCASGIITEHNIIQFYQLGLKLATVPAVTVISTPIFLIQTANSDRGNLQIDESNPHIQKLNQQLQTEIRERKLLEQKFTTSNRKMRAVFEAMTGKNELKTG